MINEKENREFKENSEQILENYFTERGYDGGEIRRGFAELYSMYRPELASWLGGLYDSRIGGFYYSNSAREGEQFLPDIESTNQATNLMVNTGMIGSCTDLPEDMRAGIERFARSLLDPCDGYIYHPQWGKNISDSRRGRDLMWANALADKLGFEYDHPTADKRLARAASRCRAEMSLPEHYADEAHFIKYLESFDWVNDSYYAGNTVAAQGNEIRAAGYANICAEFLDRYQNPSNGFWSELSDMHTGINGFFKITCFYRDSGIGIKNAKTAARTVIGCMTSEEIGTTVCHLYNVWNAMDAILNSLRESGVESDKLFADEILDELLQNAPEALLAAKRKTKVFMKPDGGFSYMRDKTSSHSQEAYVAIENTPESDVNASVLCTSGLTNAICRTLGCESVKIPIYTNFDYQRLLSAIK